MVFFLMWFWLWFDGSVGGAGICGGDCVLVVAWWLCFYLFLSVVTGARG